MNPSPLSGRPDQSTIQAISKLEAHLKNACALNIDAYNALKDLQATLGAEAVETSNLVTACRFTADAFGDIKALKAKLGIDDADTDSSAEPTPASTPGMIDWSD